MNRRYVPLRLVPEILFPPNRLRKFLARLPSYAVALHRLTEASALSGSIEERAIGDAATQDALFLVWGFQAKLARAHWVARGFAPSSGNPIVIPPEVVANLKFNFVEGSAFDEFNRYVGVEIAVTVKPTVDECVAWLNTYKAEAGNKLKRQLFADAREHFGRHLTVRVFSEAFALTFRRKRGRPGKSAS